MKKTLLLPLILFFFSNAKGQWTNDTLQNTLVRDTLGATAPMMASSFNGFTFISWFEYGPTNMFELRMQLLDSGGYKLWSQEGIVISNFPQNSAIFRYDLKVDNDGNAIVAFQDERSGRLDIVAYKIDPNGNSVWGPSGVSLTDSSSTGGLSPVIGVTRNNDVVIAWTADSASNKWIACQRISAGGTQQWSPVYRVKDISGTIKYSRPKLLPMITDDIQMQYVEETGGFPGTSTLYAQHIDAAGVNMWPSPVQVSTQTIPFFFFPEPVYDGNNGFFIAFNTSNPTNLSLNDVFVQHVDSGGNLWSNTGTEAHASTSEQKLTGSSCFVSSMNEFWVLLRVLDGGQNISGVSLQKFDSTGNTLFGSNGRAIINQDPDLYDPGTLNDAGDGVIFSASYGGFGNEHIFAIKTDYSANVLWGGQPVSLCAAPSNKDDISSGKFINNNLVFVWQDERNGSGIFAQNITGNGYTGIFTGISGINSNEFSFYPNPSNKPLLSLSPGMHSISVSDMQGKKLFSTKTNASTYSLSELSSLPEGIYFISIENETSRGVVQWCKTN